MPIWERLSREKKLRNLITTAGSVKDVPEHMVTLDEMEFPMSQAWVIDGDGLSGFIRLVDDKKLLPQRSRDYNAFAFWRDQFGVYIENEIGPQKISMDRVETDHSTVAWLYNKGADYREYIPRVARRAIIGLAVLPDALWEEAAVNGFLVGSIIGTADDARWDVDLETAILPGRNSAGIYKPDTFLSMDYLEFAFNMDFLKRDEQKAYLAKINPVGIFADMRTMK
jgi:hypothetical protein